MNRSLCFIVVLFATACTSGSLSLDCVADNAGHEACREAEGPAFFCGPDGECIEVSGCEATSCCLPGDNGDEYCQGNFGECSVCVAGDDGYCSPTTCE